MNTTPQQAQTIFGASITRNEKKGRTEVLPFFFKDKEGLGLVNSKTLQFLKTLYNSLRAEL
jgi:hypothetical protein